MKFFHFTFCFLLAIALSGQDLIKLKDSSNVLVVIKKDKGDAIDYYFLGLQDTSIHTLAKSEIVNIKYDHFQSEKLGLKPKLLLFPSLRTAYEHPYNIVERSNVFLFKRNLLKDFGKLADHMETEAQAKEIKQIDLHKKKSLVYSIAGLASFFVSMKFGGRPFGKCWFDPNCELGAPAQKFNYFFVSTVTLAGIALSHRINFTTKKNRFVNSYNRHGLVEADKTWRQVDFGFTSNGLGILVNLN